MLVSVYLGAVMLLLIASRRISAPGFLRTVRAGLRRPYRATVHEVRHERGHCYTTEVPAWLLSDADCGSRLVLLEDDVPLPHPHAAHDDIRSLGGGRFSHWEAAVYFSTPDNSDPRGNGRSYRLVEQR